MCSGTNHSRKLVSDYFTHWRSWPSRGETVYHCYNIPHLFSHLVDGIPHLEVCLRSLGPICPLRPRILFSWPGTLWADPVRPRVDTKCSHSVLRHGILQRRILLRPKLRQRRSAPKSPPQPPKSSHTTPTNTVLGSVPTETWGFRACIIQGSQQIYVVMLWFWGSQLTNLTLNGVVTSHLVAYGPALTGITLPIALILWAIGLILFLGLPDYYRQTPGQIPSFYHSIIRRKIVLWFFVTVLIQNYWLSAPYGRNWRYLFDSQHAPAWAIWLLVLAFFVFLWSALLWLFSDLSKRHSWILPMFAVGLGAPRWCQMLWGTSGMGSWVPWAGSPLAGALVGRMLWLWLGVLDAIQGVGFGMILLQTLTRFHVVFALVCAQVLGSVATIVARATAPDGNGPGAVFPNLALSREGLKSPVFWVAVLMQVAICAGFFRWFRKEQLMKP